MSVYAIHTAPARRFHVAHACVAADLPARHVASPGLVDVEALGGGMHRGLPQDLFRVTACRDERLDWRSAGGALRVMVSALRSHAVDFQTQGRGQLAIAMLTPLGLLRAFGRPWDRLRNERLPLREIVPPYQEAILHGALVAAPSGAERCAVFGRWLESRIGERRPLGGQAERVAAAAMSLLEAPELSVDELARRHRVGRRQLERDFRHWLGVAPAGYARLVRFQRAACAIAEGVPLALVAAQQGYADQAHMTRAFSETAGVTPRQLREGGGPAAALRAACAQRMVMLPACGETESLRLAA